MNKIFVISFFGLIMLIGNLSGGYRLDEQLNYPHDNKHSILIPKRIKRFIFLVNKKNKHVCLRAAFIQEMAGYIEFFLAIIVTVVLLIINYLPVWTVTFAVIITILAIDSLYTMVVYSYYRIKYK